ncbi:hypothetical protein ACU8V7_09075 [Zobellia nedashkovskayae]
MLKKNSWASIITEQDTSILTSALKKLVLNKEYRESIANTAKELAKKRHDTKIVSQNFQKIIIDAANENKS